MLAAVNDGSVLLARRIKGGELYWLPTDPDGIKDNIMADLLTRLQRASADVWHQVFG